MISSDFKVASAIDEPRALAASLIESLKNSNDIESIFRLKENFAKSHEKRNKVLNDLNETCKDLSTELSQVTTKLDLSTQSLEKQKFECELSSLMQVKSEYEDALSNVKRNIQESKMKIDKTLQDIDATERLLRLESEAPPDSQVVKLSIYKSLGIDLLEKDGLFYGAQVRSNDKNDIHTIEFEESHKFEICNAMWKLCQ